MAVSRVFWTVVGFLEIRSKKKITRIVGRARRHVLIVSAELSPISAGGGGVNVCNRALWERVDVLIYSRHSFTRNSVRHLPVVFAGLIFNRSRAMLISNRLKEGLGALNKTP